MKRTIPLLITAIGGVIMIITYFIPYTQTWNEKISIWFDILAAIAFILGGGNLLRLQLKKISDRVPGWGYALVTMVAFLATLIAGVGKIGVPPNEMYPDHSWSGDFMTEGALFWWCYEFMFKPLQATMFAMLGFFVASAAFRAFRAKNIEATLLLGTAFVILLGRTFAGVWMTDWIDPDGPLSGLRIENLTVTIMNVFTTTGTRAIMIGIALGIAATSLRVILGVDRSYLGSREE